MPTRRRCSTQASGARIKPRGGRVSGEECLVAEKLGGRHGKQARSTKPWRGWLPEGVQRKKRAPDSKGRRHALGCIEKAKRTLQGSGRTLMPIMDRGGADNRRGGPANMRRLSPGRMVSAPPMMRARGYACLTSPSPAGRYGTSRAGRKGGRGRDRGGRAPGAAFSAGAKTDPPALNRAVNRRMCGVAAGRGLRGLRAKTEKHAKQQRGAAKRFPVGKEGGETETCHGNVVLSGVKTAKE